MIGHDVIAQATGSNNPKYFLYDGHGSVRHLADNTGAITESYNYDAYGNRLDSTSASTNLLYSGEWYDSDAAQYYLRARWYSPANGLFNRMDPFAGNRQDPQSLHKYLYVHCNPINSIDPTGMFEFSLAGLTFNMNMQTMMRAIDIGRSYLQYSKAKSALTAIAVGSVIASSFINNYIGGAAELELPFGNHPMLKKWPNVKFALESKFLILNISYKTGVTYTGSSTGPGSGTGGISKTIKFNLETGQIDVSGSLGASIILHKKGPIEATIDWKFELPPAFEVGLGLSFSSGWDPLSWGTGFSILRADRSGISLLWENK
ncbi:MAG: RHS repeat-associated core domain-containing protein [Planctomycetes bacterium]|nr:RHS repeat-associated core domain-containing protein [Planctomycetota bacterium]